ncbi:MAG: response regulator transcription factor [Bacteroidetes bacterium]|nr:response regulator transcription factor [Bacteroidota bacterium]
MTTRVYPTLVLAICSDITEFKSTEGIYYKVTLNKPGEPVKSSLDFDSLLSDREKEIVQHMSEGNDAFEIAERLFISENTVRTHRKNILAKTGAKNSVHLVRMAVANGWI